MNRKIKIGLFLLITIWCLGFLVEFLPPLWDKLFYLIPYLKQNYSFVCHQDAHKLIKSGHYETLVCARCAGIYIGAFLAALANIFIAKKVTVKKEALFIGGAPMIFDSIATTFGLYPYFKTIAFLTGSLFGVVSFLYFYNAIIELLNEIRVKKH